MNSKSFLFVGSWMQPLKTLPLAERWNVLEAIVEYSTAGTVSESLTPMETIAFGFIRNEIDRMKQRRDQVCEKRRAAANSRWEREHTDSRQRDTNQVPVQHNDAKSCIGILSDAPYHNNISKSESVSESESEKKTTMSSSTRADEDGNAGKTQPYDDSELLPRFFDDSNQAKLEALAMKHRIPISKLKEMAEEITMQWALTDKTHSSYHDAASHLVFALADRVSRERKACLQAVAEGSIPANHIQGMLGVDEYIDPDGRRTYNGIDFIPNDAPPRPGKAFWWNETTHSWDDIQ